MDDQERVFFNLSKTQLFSVEQFKFTELEKGKKRERGGSGGGRQMKQIEKRNRWK